MYPIDEDEGEEDRSQPSGVLSAVGDEVSHAPTKASVPATLPGFGALSSLFAGKAEEDELPRNPVDPNQKWLAFAAGMLKGTSFHEGLSNALGGYNQQQNKDAELYQRYLPLAVNAKAAREQRRLLQMQQQQRMMSGWNTALLQNTSALLATSTGATPEAVQATVAGLVRTGQVPPQIGQAFLEQLPQDPAALSAYLRRAAIAASDPYRGVKAPKTTTLAEGAKAFRENPDGTMSEVAENPKDTVPKIDDFLSYLDQSGIGRNTPLGQRLIEAYAMKKATHAPPASSHTTIVTKQETEEAKKVGAGFGEQYIGWQKDAIKSQRDLANLRRMKQLLAGYNTGKLTPLLADVANIAQEFGIKLDPNLGAKEAVESLSNQMALAERSPAGGEGMPGSLSDSDREFLKKTVPSLNKTPGGNLLIIETQRRLAQRSIEYARMAREYRKRNGSIDEGFYDEMQKYAESTPLFGDMTPGGAPTKPKPAAGPGAKPALDIQSLVNEAKGARK